MHSTPAHTINADNTLGEGILWQQDDEMLYWTDIQESLLYRARIDGSALQSFGMPERLGSFGFTPHRDELICAFASGFALHNFQDDKTRWLHRPTLDLQAVRFNDGKVDRQGRFWAGTMVEPTADPTTPQAKLYSMDKHFTVQVHESAIRISNGICWSPDARRFYFADSPRNAIFAYDFDPDTGTIYNKRLFAKTPSDVFPDGAEVDVDGCLWSAHWGGRCVVRYTPEGKEDRVLNLPVTQAAGLGFGGPERDLLCVTSAKDGLDPEALQEQPLAGSVLIYRTTTQGLPVGRFIHQKEAVGTDWECTQRDNQKINSDR